MNIRKAWKPVVTAVVAVAMMASVAPAQAQTSAEVQAQIDALLAQIASLQAQLGGSASATACTFTRSLYLGVSGADVQCLQRYLNSAGFTVAVSGAGSVGNETMYFGALTQAAVAKWQAANGVAPAVGYWGPISQAKYRNMSPGTPGTPGTPTTCGTLSGGEGDIDDFEVLGSPSAEDIDEGDSEKVFGFEFQADSGDLCVQRVEFTLNESTSVEDEPFNLLESVALFHGDDEIASMDADNEDDWSDEGSDDWQMTFTGVNVVVEEGDTEQFYLEVTVQDGVDESGDITFDVTIPADGIRAIDGAGINQYAPSSESDAVAFTINEDPTAGDLTLSSDADDNEDMTVEVDDDSDTDDVTLLTFSLEADDESDVEIEDMIFEVNGNGADVDVMVNTLHLYRGSTLVQSEAVASSATASTEITFDNIDEVIDAGEEVEYMLKGDINDLDGSTFSEGDDLQVDLEGASIDAEDEDGNDVSPTNTVSGGTINFYTEGPSVELVSVSEEKTTTADDTNESDVGTFVIKFDVTAFGNDIYVSATDTEDTSAAADEVTYDVTVNNSATSSVTSTLTSTADDDADGNAFLVEEGQTETFTLTVVVTANGDGFFQVALLGIGWATDDTADDFIYADNLDDFETDPLFLNDN